jgi:hypothetical protein
MNSQYSDTNTFNIKKINDLAKHKVEVDIVRSQKILNHDI